jgi:hypothetical protein
LLLWRVQVELDDAWVSTDENVLRGLSVKKLETRQVMLLKGDISLLIDGD